jgi:hypothetical protein
VKIFPGKELRVEHVLASTCLPLLMQSIELDGEYYWDGSFLQHLHSMGRARADQCSGVERGRRIDLRRGMQIPIARLKRTTKLPNPGGLRDIPLLGT